MSEKKERKRCFLISPIGEEDSDTRIRADWLMETIVKPVLEDQFGYVVERSDGNYQPGIIDDQIFDSISNFELIIANLTEQNANVFYELGIAHSMGRPVIQMAESGERVPFDTVTNRVIFYGIKTPQQIDDACNELVKAVTAVEANGYVVENPFTRYRGRSVELAEATPFRKQLVEFLEAFPSILSRIERLENNPGYAGPETIGGFLSDALRSGGPSGSNANRNYLTHILAGEDAPLTQNALLRRLQAEETARLFEEAGRPEKSKLSKGDRSTSRDDSEAKED